MAGKDCTLGNVDVAAKIIGEKENFLRAIIRANGCEQDAEDILHNIFLSLVATSIPKYVECVDTYLRRAVINDIIDIYRQKNAYQARLHRNSIRYENHSVYNPIGTILIEEEFKRILHLAELKLPPYLWKVIHMRYKQEFTVKEISEVLGVKKNVVRVYLSDGLRKLREIVGVERGYENCF